MSGKLVISELTVNRFRNDLIDTWYSNANLYANYYGGGMQVSAMTGQDKRGTNFISILRNGDISVHDGFVVLFIRASGIKISNNGSKVTVWYKVSDDKKDVELSYVYDETNKQYKLME